MIRIVAANLVILVLAACSPAQHVHATLDPPAIAPGLQSALASCLAPLGFRPVHRIPATAQRIEILWIDGGRLSVETVFFTGGGWLDVIGFGDGRRALVVELSDCLASRAPGLTLALQHHGRFVWGFPGMLDSR